MMAQHDILATVLKHSSLNVADTLTSLTSKLQIDLKQDLRYEELPSYSHDLSVLRELVACLAKKQQSASLDKAALGVVTMVIQEICLPLVKKIHPSADSRANMLVLLGRVGQLIATCVYVDCQLMTHVLKQLEKHMETFLTEKPTTFDLLNDSTLVDIHTILEALRHIFNGIWKNESLFKNQENLDLTRILFKMLCQALDTISVDLIGRLCIPVMLKMLKLDESKVDECIEEIWGNVQSLYKDGDLRKTFILLCGFANHFFPVSGESLSTDVRTNSQFWEMLQCGLYSKDSVNRKRALYLLKRVVDICGSVGAKVNCNGGQHMFWWSEQRNGELSKTWEDFMMFAEVLEEKQVHVIKPLLPRMKSLVRACVMKDKQDAPILHTSWLKTIFLRCSHHESLQIIRWSAETVLSLDLAKCPMLEQGLDNYLTGEMLYSLQEAKLYNREVGTPARTMPMIAVKLAEFFHACWSSLPQDKKGVFFCQTVRNICSRDWGPIPLLFICRGLALLPESPCLDREAVLSMRKMLTGFLVAVETFFRGAIQGFLVQMLTSLTDKTRVPLEDFIQILSLVRREECLQRGTVLWSRCVTWLKQEVNDSQSDWSSEGIREYLDVAVTKYLETSHESKYSTADSASALMVARLLMMASDASIATQLDENGCSILVKVCQVLVSVMNSINTHAYMSMHKADKAMLLLNFLLKELGPKGKTLDDPVAKVILLSMESCQAEILEYIGRQIMEVNLCDLSLLDLYLDSVQLMTSVSGTVKGVNFNRLADVCIKCLNRAPDDQISDLHMKMQHLSCICIMGTLADFLSHDQSINSHTDLINKMCNFMKSWKIVTTFPKPKTELSLSQQEWGKVTSQFLQSEWQVVKVAVQYSAAPWCDMQELLSLAEDTLSVGVEETTIVVQQCLKLVIPKVVSSGSYLEETLLSTLDTCWSSLQESRRILAFWDVLESFVQVAYLPCLLAMSEESPVIEKLKLFADKLIVMGTDKNGVVNVLVDQLYMAYTQQPHMMDHVGKMASVIVDLCMFGGLIRRGVRQTFDICSALEATGDECPANGILSLLKNEDIHVKVKVISLLCHLDDSNQVHCCLATDIVRRCFEEYRETLKGSYNHFPNSLVHRKRHRLVQTILLLQSFVTKEYVGELWKFTWTSLEMEIHPSVRHMLEWISMCCMYRYEEHRKQIWQLIDKYRDTRNVTMCSLLCILIHLGPHLPQEELESYYSNSLRNILPWCMAHHFQTRIYSQAVLIKLWEQIQSLGLHQLQTQHAILQCITEFNHTNRNSTTNVKRLLDSFFFKFLDFKHDFSLETLFYVMPKMTSLTEEDWIPPELFALTNPAWQAGCDPVFIRLRNTTDKFNDCDPAIWKNITVKILEEDDAAADGTDNGSDGDVQKKIQPWRQMMLDEEVATEVDYGVKQAPGGGLVVVTSLINKVPNLGGLCRTSEIFGVSEYVLGRLQYVEDRAFQGLSVTAHKWVPITEVHESKLSDYLQQMRQEGYTLVGVEQTANSVCLTEYDFPTKTLLLLGNEKEGIPVELIGLLDVCVEIPQQGVIRSLNVHVSGAILIWEYRRQQIMKTLASS